MCATRTPIPLPINLPSDFSAVKNNIANTTLCVCMCMRGLIRAGEKLLALPNRTKVSTPSISIIVVSLVSRVGNVGLRRGEKKVERSLKRIEKGEDEERESEREKERGRGGRGGHGEEAKEMRRLRLTRLGREKKRNTRRRGKALKQREVESETKNIERLQ